MWTEYMSIIIHQVKEISDKGAHTEEVIWISYQIRLFFKYLWAYKTSTYLSFELFQFTGAKMFEQQRPHNYKTKKGEAGCWPPGETVSTWINSFTGNWDFQFLIINSTQRFVFCKTKLIGLAKYYIWNIFFYYSLFCDYKTFCIVCGRDRLTQ